MRNHQVISIIMPAYNSEEYISEALDSVLAQTYSYWELLVIDDGSVDSTGTIIDEYAQKDKRIHCFHTENKGVSQARNTGLDRITGEWITFLDSDDLLEKKALESLLAASDGQDLVIGNYCEFPGMKQKKFLSDVRDIDIAELVKPKTLVGSVWGMIFRKDVLKERFLPDIQFGEDTLFLYSELKHCTHISTIHDIVYLYRRSNLQSLSRQRQNLRCEFIEKYCGLLQELTVKDPDYFYATYIAHYFVKYVDWTIHADVLKKEEKKERILEVMQNRRFLEIPLVQLRLESYEMRLFMLLKTGDMKLIERELDFE